MSKKNNLKLRKSKQDALRKREIAMADKRAKKLARAKNKETFASDLTADVEMKCSSEPTKRKTIRRRINEVNRLKSKGYKLNI